MNKTPTSDTCRNETKAARAGVQDGIRQDLMLFFFSDISTWRRNGAKVTDTAHVNSTAAHLKRANAQSACDHMPAELSQQMKLRLLDLVTCCS